MAGSYLGHGAKYWADRYFESQTQTQMPDDYSAIEWRDKYLSLEKNCALYQSTIADLRTEVADLRQKAPSKSESGLFEGHTAEYWYNETANLNKLLDSQYSVAENAINSLSASCKEKDSQLHKQASQIQELQNSLSVSNEHLDQQSQILLSLRSENNSLHKQNCTVHQRKNFYFSPRMLLFAVSIIAVVFLSGLLLGEGYFVPHFTPSSPFIDELQESAQTAHMDGYSNGFKVGRRVGYKAGYEDGYSEGYSKEESLSESDSHWTAEKVRQMLESPPSQK